MRLCSCLDDSRSMAVAALGCQAVLRRYPHTAEIRAWDE